MSERTGRVAENMIKAIQRLLELALLLVNYPQAEQDLVFLVKV